MQVNAETLQVKISGLEESLHIGGALSLNQEYQLEAYKMLLQLLKDGVKGGVRAECSCDCQFWHYDESREQCICNSCLGVKPHD